MYSSQGWINQYFGPCHMPIWSLSHANSTSNRPLQRDLMPTHFQKIFQHELSPWSHWELIKVWIGVTQIKDICWVFPDKSGFIKGLEETFTQEPRSLVCVVVSKEEGESDSWDLPDILCHHLLWLKSLTKRHMEVSSKDCWCPVSTCLDLKVTSSTGMKEGCSTSSQWMSWVLLRGQASLGQ